MNTDELEHGLNTFEPRLRSAVGAVMERSKDQAVAHMRTNAPWTDRTGNARSGLDGIVFRQGGGWVMNLFGRAPYQIWLEVKNQGRYAIITPTIQRWGPRTMAMMTGLIDRLNVRGRT
jgi:hypothetical protein